MTPIGFYAIRGTRRRAHPHACECWDHLRAVGLTPSRGLVEKHPDVLGVVHRSDNGNAVTPVEHPADALAAAPIEELAA